MWDLEGIMKGTLAEVSFTLHHQHINSFNWDLFHAEVLKVAIIREVGLPQTDIVGRGASAVCAEDMWFPTRVPAWV